MYEQPQPGQPYQPTGVYLPPPPPPPPKKSSAKPWLIAGAVFIVGLCGIGVAAAATSDNTSADRPAAAPDAGDNGIFDRDTEQRGEPAAEPATPPQPEPEEEPAPEPELTVAQEQAIGSAESYLRYSGFSRTGLIDQLEFEGFTSEDAEFAVDYLDVDWKEQAVRVAQGYLDYSHFSRQGLIDQLEFEGFTHKQAEHGANEVGL
jgi:hypothetical protein